MLYYLIKIIGSSLQFEGIRSAQIEEPTLFHQNQNQKKKKKNHTQVFNLNFIHISKKQMYTFL